MVERVCVLGGTLQEAIQLLDILCEANEETIFRRRTNVGIMNDGTELIAMAAEDRVGFVGRRFDYVFYKKGRLGVHCVRHGTTLELLQRCCLKYSEIPGEFQWCAVDTN
jgi:hypothetical protein